MKPPDIEIKTEKDLTILDENIFKSNSLSNHNSSKTHSMRFDKDSWIWCFTGRRGGGKTTAMTFYVARAVALYNMRVISNYPIEFNMRRHRPDGKTYLQHVRSEDLDFEKLICFDEGYRHVLICIDESPDVISHMASQSWRNRLVDAFTRQIRKNRNSMLLAAQEFNWIDKGMRWQVDVEIQCKDAASWLGDGCNMERGEQLWLNWYDNSRVWTNHNTEDRLKMRLNPCVIRKKIHPRVLWGDGHHKPVFDSWHQIDIMESLRKVDIRMTSIKIGDKVDGGGYNLQPDILLKALNSIESIVYQSPDNPTAYQKAFYKSIGANGEKNNLGKLLSDYGAEVVHAGPKWVFNFSNFDLDGMRNYIESRLPQ